MGLDTKYNSKLSQPMISYSDPSLVLSWLPLCLKAQIINKGLGGIEPSNLSTCKSYPSVLWWKDERWNVIFSCRNEKWLN